MTQRRKEVCLLKFPGSAQWTLLFLLIPRLLDCQTANSQAQLASEDILNLRKYVQDRMAADQIPSIAISVVLGDKILWEEGFGLADRERRVPASAHTPFYLASITKAITGTAVVVLQDQGKINVDHPVNDYLGKAKVRSPMWNPAGATVRRVATHTAGLTTYNRKCALADSHCEVSTDTAIRRYGILFWPPGEHFDYSNLGYGILGEVVAHASDESYADFLRDKVFLPLGMNDCFVGTANTSAGPPAAQYDSSSHARTPAELSDTPGASSAHCSVHDLALFGMFALGEQLPSQKRILSTAALHMMLNPTVNAGDGERYGFGWALQPDHHGYVGLYAQGGTNDSFAVLQMIPSEKIAVAVIANTGTTVPFEIVDKILSALLPRYRETLANEKPPAPQPEAKPVTSSLLVGSWTGILQTWNGKVPLAIEIPPSFQVRTKWSTDRWTTASNVSVADPRFYCVARGVIGTPDAPKSASDVEFELYLHNGVLVGAATTKDGVQLPYWVQLRPSSLRPNNPAN
jgi:CubicO group peptidase (beta-lactamase class C family)